MKAYVDCLWTENRLTSKIDAKMQMMVDRVKYVHSSEVMNNPIYDYNIICFSFNTQ